MRARAESGYRFPMRFFVLLPALLCVACATVESDHSSNDPLAMVRTRIDFSPISRPEREKLLQYEKHSLEKNTAPIQEELTEVTEARNNRYNEIKDKFPACHSQKHCISTLSHGNVKKFELYTQLTKSLQEIDIRLIGLQADLAAWKNRYELRTRAIHNRFLVHELLQIWKVDPRIAKISVHSLEAYESRRQLSLRLLQLAGQDLEAATWGDLNFRMFGRPVDEAAVLASFDIWLSADASGNAGRLGERFVVNFLVNSYQADALVYDNGFMKYWANLFAERQQRGLREKALCATFSIANETLAPRLSSTKGKTCGVERSRLQAAVKGGYVAPEDWLLPLGYFRPPQQ